MDHEFQHLTPPDKKSGRWESNPHDQLGRLKPTNINSDKTNTSESHTPNTSNSPSSKMNFGPEETGMNAELNDIRRLIGDAIRDISEGNQSRAIETLDKVKKILSMMAEIY